MPSTAEKVTSSFLANPQTGEIINASVFVPANVGDQIYRWLFLGSAASDATMRTFSSSTRQVQSGFEVYGSMRSRAKPWFA